jgi:hypothetical protein
MHGDATRSKAKQVQPSEGGGVLVLLADGLLKDLDLDVARLFGKLCRRDTLAAQRVERVQQTHGEAARPAQPGRCRDIRHSAHVDRRIDFEEEQAFSRNVIFDFRDFVYLLGARIVDPHRLEKQFAVPLYGDVDILIDRSAEHCAFVLAVELRQIRSSAGEADPQRRSRNDHTGVVARYRSQNRWSSYRRKDCQFPWHNDSSESTCQ